MSHNLWLGLLGKVKQTKEKKKSSMNTDGG